MFQLRTTFENSKFLALADLTKKGLVAVLFLVAGRWLGAAQFGEYVFIFTLVQVAGILTGPGLQLYVAREVSSERESPDPLYRNSVLLRCLLSLFVITAVVAGVKLWHYQRETVLNIFIYSLSLFPRCVIENALGVFQALQKMKYCAYASYVQWYLTSVVGLVAILGGYGVRVQLIIHTLAALAAMGLVLRWLSSEFRMKPDSHRFAGWKELFRAGLVFNSSFVFSMLYNRVDIILLSVLVGQVAVGIYGAPYRIFDFTQLIPASLLTAMFPTMSLAAAGGSIAPAYRKVAKGLLLAASLIVLVIFILAEQGVGLVLGPGYGASANVLRILIWAVIPMYLNFLFNMILMSSKEENVVAFTSGCCLLFNFVANLLVIPRWSYMGAAVTTVATELLLLGLSFYFVGRRFASVVKVSELLGVVSVLGISALSVVRIERWAGHVPSLMVGSAIYVASLLVFGIVTRKDFEVLRRAFHSLSVHPSGGSQPCP